MKIFRKAKIIFCASIITLSALSFAPSLGLIAQTQGADDFSIEICNPLSADCTGGSQTIESLIISIIDYILLIGAPIAAIMYVWAGFMFLTAAGNETKIKVAKQAVIWTSIGLAIILLGRGLVEAVKSFF